MNLSRRQYSVTTGVVIGLAFCFLLNAPARAQFTADYQTNTISGVTSNWAGHYIVGNNMVYDQLQTISGGRLAIGGDLSVGYNGGSRNSMIISSGGTVTDGTGWVGNQGNLNSALVTGSGSVWSNGSTLLYVGDQGSFNSLVVNNGGKVLNYATYIGTTPNNSTAISNSLAITGPGSVMSNSWTFVVGNRADANSLVISAGGALVDHAAWVGNNASNNSALVTGSGSVWHNQADTFYVGDQGSGNSLVISNGGRVVAAISQIGGNGEANNNSAVITGSGSVWTNSGDLFIGGGGANNSVKISNGGQVFNRSGDLGGGGGNQAVLVTDSGSVWYNASNLWVGSGAPNSTLTISNGGAVYSENGYLGWDTDSSNSRAIITGGGSVWSNRTGVYVGYDGAGNSLTIVNGGKVMSPNVYVGLNPTSTGNSITLNGGSLTATNAGSGALTVFRGTVTMNSGSTVTVDQLSVTNGAASVFIFNGGTLNTGGTKVNNGSQFAVGNGSSAATLNLQGGTHSFTNSLLISQNAVLKGTGRIFANLTLAGTLAPGNSAGAITNFGNLTLQSSAVLDMELGGTIQGSQYDFIQVTNGTVTLDGLLQVSFINGFASSVSSNDMFVLLQSNSPLGGTFTNLVGSRVTTAGGEGSFYVDYVNNSVRLSGYQVVPEPSTLALCVVALVTLFAARRRSGISRT